nr:antitermination protein NusG [Enterobacter bugandensis]
MTEREVSIFGVIGEEVRAMIKEAGERHQAELLECTSKIARLEKEVEGLISLLGES